MSFLDSEGKPADRHYTIANRTGLKNRLTFFIANGDRNDAPRPISIVVDVPQNDTVNLSLRSLVEPWENQFDAAHPAPAERDLVLIQVQQETF
jgi:hypothetical protein